MHLHCFKIDYNEVEKNKIFINELLNKKDKYIDFIMDIDQSVSIFDNIDNNITYLVDIDELL